MIKLGLAPVACLALVIGSAHAQTAPAAGQAAPAKTAPRERLICHEDYEIGSMIHKKKICLTAAQWRQVTSENANEFERHTAMKEGMSTR